MINFNALRLTRHGDRGGVVKSTDTFPRKGLSRCLRCDPHFVCDRFRGCANADQRAERGGSISAAGEAEYELAETRTAGCPYRTLYPDVAVVQSANQRNGDDASDMLDRAGFGSVLAQCEVRPRLVVIAGVGVENPAQMVFTPDDDVVQALVAD